jgi:Tfp pilus assembly ATPase PilU
MTIVDEVEDINRLIRELNAEGREEVTGEDSARLDRWLERLLERRGSDLLLVAGSPPCVRIDGAVVALPEAPVSGEEIEEAVLPALPGRARSQYAQEKNADASYKLRGRGRFRVNLHRERGLDFGPPAVRPAQISRRKSTRVRIPQTSVNVSRKSQGA